MSKLKMPMHVAGKMQGENRGLINLQFNEGKLWLEGDGFFSCNFHPCRIARSVSLVIVTSQL